MVDTPRRLSVAQGLYADNTSGDISAQDLRDGVQTWHPEAMGVYNVKADGAKGDGSTDDTTAIQTSIDAASAAGGGTVLIPPGTYIVKATAQFDSAIHMKDNVALAGVGMGASIIKMADDQGAGRDVIGDRSAGASHDYVAIYDLSVDGNRVGRGLASDNDEGSHCIDLGRNIFTNNVDIHNVEAYNAPGDGIVVHEPGGSRVRINNNYVHDCYRAGINCHGADYATITGNVIWQVDKGIRLEPNSGDNLGGIGPQSIVGNTVYAAQPIWIVSVDYPNSYGANVVIDGNTCVGIPNATLSGSGLYQSPGPRSGIRLEGGSQHVVISNNIIKDSGAGTASGNIKGNSIHIGNDCSDVLIDGNICWNLQDNSSNINEGHISLEYDIERITITNNYLHYDADSDGPYGGIVSRAGPTPDKVTDLLIANNHIVGAGGTWPAIGISGDERVHIVGNKIVMDAAGTATAAIYVVGDGTNECIDVFIANNVAETAGASQEMLSLDTGAVNCAVFNNVTWNATSFNATAVGSYSTLVQANNYAGTTAWS